MIRTAEQLIDNIAEDLVWRRKELTELRNLIQRSTGELQCRVLMRASVALLYAHWEGFVKTTSQYYLEFVASHRVINRRLAPNFLGLSIRDRFHEFAASQRIAAGNELAAFMVDRLDSPSRIPYRGVVDTKSNLSSKVLIDIIAALGLDPERFATRLNFIDTNLLNPRNHIAHGEALSLSVEEYLQLHEDVISLIEKFRTEVENSSVLRRFERDLEASSVRS